MIIIHIIQKIYKFIHSSYITVNQSVNFYGKIRKAIDKYFCIHVIYYISLSSIID